MTFKLKQHLKIHRKSCLNIRQYFCDYNGCNQTFNTTSNLSVHKLLHSGERPYKCNWKGCDKKYVLSSHLTVHMRTHTGEKPFVCDIKGCEYKTMTSKSLKTDTDFGNIQMKSHLNAISMDAKRHSERKHNSFKHKNSVHIENQNLMFVSGKTVNFPFHSKQV